MAGTPMTEDRHVEQDQPPRDELPRPVVQQRRFRESLIWLVPVLAALVGLSLVIHNWLQAGPQITISFQSAEGLDAGKTPGEYKNVVIGRVKTIHLSADHSHVLVEVALEKSAKGFATKGTRYWVVRPRIGLGGVSGLDTLFSGAFIGADVGESNEPQDDFVALEAPPAVTHGALGRSFVLHADDLGSLDVGSPVYYRRIQVGRVASYALDRDGKGVSVQIFIDGPNDRFVTKSSRFWNASGVDLSVGANGLKLNTQSLAAVLAGGVAFQDPPGPHDATRAPEDTRFELFGDRDTAMAPPDGEPHFIRMRFAQSVRGLAVDGAVVYPQRLGSAYAKLQAMARERGEGTDLPRMMGRLVAHGLRAQARTGNLLTGQLYVALDFVPHAAKASFDPDAKPLTLPTAPGSFDKLQEQVAEIVDKLDKVPFDSIGRNLDQTLAGLNATLKQVNGQTLPAVKDTLQGVQKTLGTANQAFSGDSPLQRNLGATLEQVQRMARSLRVLTDYLGGHPEALLRGRRADPPPVRPAPPDQSKQGNRP